MYAQKASALACELNNAIISANKHVYEMLSEMGKALFFPKGILSQTAQAKKQASLYNATIGIAKQGGAVMSLPSVTKFFSQISPDEILPYASSYGKPELRKLWQEHIFMKNPQLKSKRITLPIVTSGITHGLSLVGDLFLDIGDKLILPDKMWGNYKLIFKLRHGADIVSYPFFNSRGEFNAAGLADTLKGASTSGKVIVILNFPNNPTGYSITHVEAAAIRDVLVSTANSGCNIVAVCDDAYFGLFFEDNLLKESLFGYLSDSHQRLLNIKLDAATKEDYVWGFRLGFITYNALVQGDTSLLYDALEKKTAADIRGNISNCPYPSQSIMLKAMCDNKYPAEKQEKFNVLCRRAKKVKQVLSDERFSLVWEAYPFNSGYFMCLRLKSLDAEKFRVYLLEKYHVGVISMGKHDIRVAFSCTEEENIAQLFDIMFQAACELQNIKQEDI